MLVSLARVLLVLMSVLSSLDSREGESRSAHMAKGVVVGQDKDDRSSSTKECTNFIALNFIPLPPCRISRQRYCHTITGAFKSATGVCLSILQYQCPRSSTLSDPVLAISLHEGKEKQRHFFSTIQPLFRQNCCAFIKTHAHASSSQCPPSSAFLNAPVAPYALT